MKRIFIAIFSGFIVAGFLATLPVLAQWIGPTDTPPNTMPIFPEFVDFGLGSPELGTTTNAGIWIEDNGGGDLIRLLSTAWADPLFVVGSDGNVGVQRIPGFKLDVGDVDNGAVEGDLNAARLCFNGDCRDDWIAVISAVGGGTAGYIIKWDADERLTNTVIFESGTLIGIDKASPAYQLDVNGDANATRWCIAGISCIPNWASAGTDNQFLFNTISTPSGTAIADSATDTLTFAQAGGILISGASTPDTITFNIDSSVVQDRVTGTCGSSQAIWVIATNGTVSCVSIGETTSDWTISGTDQYSAVSGNVGIGTTTPSEKLEVGGNIKLGGEVLAGGGTSGAPTYSFGADSNTGMYRSGSNKISFAAGGTKAMSVSSSGVTIGSNGNGKLTVGTIDPLYTISGEKYATYVAGMIGQKEEMTDVATLKDGKYVIEFMNQEKGSDLWLFGKTTNIEKNFDKLIVLLTPSFGGDVWYESDRKNLTVTIRGDEDAEVSYRLTAPRFDWAEWTNFAEDEGFDGFILD